MVILYWCQMLLWPIKHFIQEMLQIIIDYYIVHSKVFLFKEMLITFQCSLYVVTPTNVYCMLIMNPFFKISDSFLTVQKNQQKLFNIKKLRTFHRWNSFNYFFMKTVDSPTYVLWDNVVNECVPHYKCISFT